MRTLGAEIKNKSGEESKVRVTLDFRFSQIRTDENVPKVMIRAPSLQGVPFPMFILDYRIDG